MANPDNLVFFSPIIVDDRCGLVPQDAEHVRLASFPAAFGARFMQLELPCLVSTVYFSVPRQVL